MQISDDLMDVHVAVSVKELSCSSLPAKHDTSPATTMLESDDALSDTTHPTSSSDNELSQPAHFQPITPIPTTTLTPNNINNDNDDFEDAVFDQPSDLGPTAGFGQTRDGALDDDFEDFGKENEHEAQRFDEDVFDRDNDDFDNSGFGQNIGEDEFGDFDNSFPENDDFGDFDDFDDDLHTDLDFPPQEPAIAVPPEPTEAEIYSRKLTRSYLGQGIRGCRGTKGDRRPCRAASRQTLGTNLGRSA
ncbi:hypothetical protein CLU79DRAFT_5273 [Phycomyces nitens]|nr:hypothetical protein CLU79DRAFT_5273 [Phycomyces nitens]